MVSIIIPVYNAERYIEACLQSFETQEYKEFEIIVVDDGSNDRSLLLIDNYIRRSKLDIKLLRQKNLGVSVARNKGIEYARGEYICFVDSDDMVATNYLSKMIQVLKETATDLVICSFDCIDEACIQNNGIYDEQIRVNVLNTEEALIKFLYRDISSGVWAMMIKSYVLKKNNILFSPGYRYSEDVEFIFKVIAHSQIISYINNKLYLYRVNNESVMSLVDDKRIDGYILMKGLEKYFAEINSSFSQLYKKFGVARWVWATLWQSALANKKYKSFEKSFFKIDGKSNMRKLLFYPRAKVALFSWIFCISPYLYFNTIRYLHSYIIKTTKKNDRRSVFKVHESE